MQFANDKIVYKDNLTDFTKKLLYLTVNLAKQQGHKVNIQKLKKFLYTNNEISEIEIGKNSICCSIKKNKVPRNKPNKEVKALYSENYTTLKKEMKEDTNKWKHVPCSWIGRINIIKWPYCPKQFIDSIQSLSEYP